MKKTIRSQVFLPLVSLIIIFLPMRLFNITTPLHNITNFRQAQTATIALNFYKNGINLFQTELDIFGIGKEKYLTLEFPLYQAVVAVLYKIFFVHDMWGRVVSVVSGFVSAMFLYKIVLFISKNHTLAFISSFFFLSVPLNMYHQQDFLIESFVVMCILTGFYYFLQWIHSKRKIQFILTLLFLSLGYIQKPMYGPFLLIPILYYSMRHSSLKRMLSIQFLILVIVPLIVLYIWTAHINGINIQSGHSYFTTYNNDHFLWNVGTWEDRLNLSFWNFRFNNILNGMFLKPGVVFFFLGFLFVRNIKNKDFLFVYLFGEILYFLIFFRIQSHVYYQMIITPITSIFMALGIVGSVTYLLRKFKKTNVRIFRNLILASVLAVFLWRSFLSSQWDASADINWYQRITSINRVIPKDSAGIFVSPGYDWNSAYTYFPKIKVLLISVEDFTADNLSKWQKGGYSYVVFYNYGSFEEYLSKVHIESSQEFIKNYGEVLSLPDFKVYLL